MNRQTRQALRAGAKALRDQAKPLTFDARAYAAGARYPTAERAARLHAKLHAQADLLDAMSKEPTNAPDQS